MTRIEAAAMLLLGGLVPLALVPAVHTRLTLLNLALLGGLVVWTTVGLVVHTGALPTRFGAAMFYVFGYVFVAIASLAQALPSTYPLDGLDYPQSLVTSHLLLLGIGLVAFEIGRHVMRRVTARREREERALGGVPESRAARPTLGISPERVLAMAVIGLLDVAYQVASHGITAFFVSRQQTQNLLSGLAADEVQQYLVVGKAKGLILTFLAQYFVFIALYLALYARRHRLWNGDEVIGRLGWQIVLALLVIANLIMNNPLGNGRYWFCLIGVCFATVFFFPHRRRVVVLLMSGALVVLLFAFPILDFFRYTAHEKNEYKASGLLSGDYPVLQTGLNGENYVLAHGHTYGRQVLGSLLGFVPRSIWATKPNDTGYLIDPQYARSASSWTESSVDFGLFGVVGLFLLWGAVCYAADQRLGDGVPGLIPATITLMATYQLFLLRGSWLSGFATAYQLLFLLAVTATVVRPPPPSDRASPSPSPEAVSR